MKPQKRLENAIKYVSRQWGHGWPKLSPHLQEALVRAEMFAEISRLDGIGTDPIAYRALVEEITDITMRWTP